MNGGDKVSGGLVYCINKKPCYQLRLTIIQCLSVIFDMNQFIKADYYSNFIRSLCIILGLVLA